MGMTWKESFSLHMAPGAFAGITFGRWLRVLRENYFDVDLRYWARAALVTAGSIGNSLLARMENLRYGRGIRETTVHPPLFVLGIWRSGTTHLHNLLARDDRFAYPSFFDVLYPHTFLSIEKTSSRLIAAFVPGKRPQDNMSMGVSEPQEDEFALCSLTGRSYLMTLAFPRRAKHYERYLTLRDVSAEELSEWKAALLGFVQKLAFKYGRPLVLKSPGHTARVQLLLSMFPGAKFVHIHRNPFEVFQSARHSVLKLAPYWTLQRSEYTELDDDIIRQYKQVCSAYLEEQSLIPRSHLYEISFARLEADPLSAMREIYQALDLPDFAYVAPKLKECLGSLAEYRRNVFREVPGDLRSRIAEEWRTWIEEWGYSF
jgi:hypothetical protein